MKNKLADLNDHLFASMERLGDEGLSSEELNKEIGRANAISGTARQILGNANLVMKAAKMREDRLLGENEHKQLIGVDK